MIGAYAPYTFRVSAPEVVASVAAVVSVVSTFYGVTDRYRASKREQQALDLQRETLNNDVSRWKTELGAARGGQLVLLQKDFHLEQYRYRVAAYGDVLNTLGAVSDVSIPDGPDPYRVLHQNRSNLERTAEALYNHLYGRAGLLMTMRTRNYLHTARRECLSFLASDGDKIHGDKLVNAFFDARRYLRADLELLDDRSPQTLEKIAEQLRVEAGPKRAAPPAED